MKLLDGRMVRDERKAQLRERVEACSVKPALAIVQVGTRADSTAYIEQKKKFGADIGVEVSHHMYDETISENDLVHAVAELNANDAVHGIIVQLPLPDTLNVSRVIEAIDPSKDVDGLTSINVKRLQAGSNEGHMPATARGIETLLDHYKVDMVAKHAVVVGRSQLVGTPVVHMLLNRGATVTVCHKQTKDLAAHTREADILVVATGHAHLIGHEHVKKGQVVVDVGINVLGGTPLQEELPDKTCTGDVDFQAVKDVVEAVSPVPGGVGPMTVLSLFENLLDAVE